MRNATFKKGLPQTNLGEEMVFDQVGSALTNATIDFVNFVPNLVGALILLIIGLVIGKVVGRVVKELLDKVKVDYYIHETKKPVISLSSLFSLILRWWVYMAFIVAAVAVLRVPELTSWTIQIRDIIPGIIGASIVVVVGYVIAEYIRSQLSKMNKFYAEVVGKILLFFILYVAIATALPVLGVTAPLVNNILLIIIASLGLAMAIALGLGLKDAVSDISRRYVKKLRI